MQQPKTSSTVNAQDDKMGRLGLAAVSVVTYVATYVGFVSNKNKNVTPIYANKYNAVFIH